MKGKSQKFSFQRVVENPGKGKIMQKIQMKVTAQSRRGKILRYRKYVAGDIRKIVVV